jgi:hypothetical protein
MPNSDHFRSFFHCLAESQFIETINFSDTFHPNQEILASKSESMSIILSQQPYPSSNMLIESEHHPDEK